MQLQFEPIGSTPMPVGFEPIKICTAEVITLNNTPRHKHFRSVVLLLNGAYITGGGSVTFMLGGTLAFEMYLPSGSEPSDAITIYSGVLPVDVSEFSCSHVLTGGNPQLILVAW